MNKKYKSFSKKLASLLLVGVISLSTISAVFADSYKVVTLGANLKPNQKQEMLNYFGVKDGEAQVLEINNAEERQYLKGIATDEQMGHITISSSYTEPTKEGSGLNVKTHNLTWVTKTMIANSLVTLGITDANVIAAAPFPVSGTGALTGIIKGFENSTGKKLDQDKKEVANKELIVTGHIGESVGQDKAAGIINDIKTKVIKEKPKDAQSIETIINNVTNNYNVSLSAKEKDMLVELMHKVNGLDIDFSSIKKSLGTIAKDIKNLLNGKSSDSNSSANANASSNSNGTSDTDGFFAKLLDSAKHFFQSIVDWISSLFK